MITNPDGRSSRLERLAKLARVALVVDRRPSLGHDRATSNALTDLANSLHKVAFYRRPMPFS